MKRCALCCVLVNFFLSLASTAACCYCTAVTRISTLLNTHTNQQFLTLLIVILT